MGIANEKRIEELLSKIDGKPDRNSIRSDFPGLSLHEAVELKVLLINCSVEQAQESIKNSRQTLDFKTSLDDYVEAHQSTFSYADLHEDGWNLGDQKVLSLLEKLKNAGTPLGEFVDHKFYRGVLTGLNEAFVIDFETRAQLIAEDPQSEKIIKPFLAGRDIKRYQQPKSDKFLILFEKGYTDKSRGKLDAEDWLKNTFPAIHQHLIPNKEAAAKRYDKGDYWWELRACDYYGEFVKPKIIIPAIVKSASYTWDSEGFFSNDKTSIITGVEKYFLGILNSKAIDFYLKQIASTKQNGYFEYKPVYVSQLPICNVNDDQKVLLEELVQKVLSAKAANPQQDTTEWEAEIDALVYELYGLTAEDIAVVESA